MSGRVPAVVTCLTCVVALTGCADSSQSRTSDGSIRITAAAPTSDGLVAAFPWAHDGYCAGQFTVRSTESDSTVSLGDIHDEATSGNAAPDCGGFGSDGRHATLHVQLEEPLGSRTVKRRTDDSRVTIVTSPSELPSLFASGDRATPPRR